MFFKPLEVELFDTWIDEHDEHMVSFFCNQQMCFIAMEASLYHEAIETILNANIQRTIGQEIQDCLTISNYECVSYDSETTLYIVYEFLFINYRDN